VKRFRQVAAYILAGGASSRMGRDKGLLEFGGVPHIVRTARLIEPLANTVTIVGPAERYAALGLPVIPDKNVPAGEAPGKRSGGPLRGIVAALEATRAPWNLILACDLPYLRAEWLEWLLSRAIASNAQIVIPRTEHGLEPLAAVYRRECSAAITDSLARGVRKATLAIEELELVVVTHNEWQGTDPHGLVLQNMNTPEDYERARRWWSAERSGESAHVRKHRPSRRRKPRSAPRPSK
jgi:molybdopterin-guanine dinucleotide biosynthesis protein A